MKVILSNSWHTVLRFDKGDDVVEGILNLAQKENITAGWLSAIGSATDIELGFYNLDKKEYKNKFFEGPLELVEASGTIAAKGGEPTLHWHGAFSDENYETIAGHIHKMKAYATVEVFIHKMEGRMERQKDSKTGLNLLK